MTWWEEIYDKVLVPENSDHLGMFGSVEVTPPTTSEVRDRNFDFFLSTLIHDGYILRSHLVLCLDGEEYLYDSAIQGPDKGSGFFIFFVKFL